MLINEVVNFQSVTEKVLKLVVLVQWHARIGFYALQHKAIKNWKFRNKSRKTRGREK